MKVIVGVFFLLRQDEGKSWCLLRPAPNPMGIKKLMSIVLFNEHL